MFAACLTDVEVVVRAAEAAAKNARTLTRQPLVSDVMVARRAMDNAAFNCVRLAEATPGSPGVSKPDVASEAVAADVAGRDRELIAGLGIRAPVGVDLDRPAAGELKPGRLLQQWHLDRRSVKSRRGARPPASPDVASDVGLSHLSAVCDDRGLS